MKALYSIFTSVAFVSILISFLGIGVPGSDPVFSESSAYAIIQEDTGKKDTTKLRYPIDNPSQYEEKKQNNLDLKDPENIKKETYYDTATGTYKERETIGGEEYRPTKSKSLDDYLKETEKKEVNDYFRQRSNANTFITGGGIIPPLVVGPKIFDKIFGSGTVDIRPTGSAELIFGFNHNVVRNPQFTARQQRNGQFDFKQKIQINLTGSIGDRLKMGINYDTEATFDFENQTKLNWAGKEDDIIKAVEVGNVSLPLNSSLISGGTSLFGVKTQFQFGRLTVTSVFTQQRGQTTETQVTGGAQINKFDIQADNYDVNRHYFIAQYFANNYDNWLANLPIVTSPVIINRIEVWVTNRTNDFTTSRDIIGFMDLGEQEPYNPRWAFPSAPQYSDNGSNTLYQFLVSGGAATRSSFTAITTLEAQNFDKIRDFQFLSNARQLSANEYTFNPRLGYISLNTALNNDEILAVAYEYQVNGQVYRVGDLTKDYPDAQANPQALFLKLLKGATITTALPIWDLMMKNIYSLGSFNIQEDKFQLNVEYADDPTGADYTYIPVQGEGLINGIPLISVLNLDRVNVQREAAPDGVFDFTPGITINPQNGRIIFPVREPFGRYLRTKFSSQANADRYVYQELYDSTKWLAQQVVQKNKFFLRGSYQSSANNEISLNAFNIPKGSVKVTANGTLLNENTDYIVDYTLGRVKIINTGLLESGAVIKVSSENNSLFMIQQKTLVGSRFDYKVNPDLILGGTIMHLWERPITPKVNIGDEPLLNTIFGFDGSYRKDSRWLTKMIDKLPFIETKEVSSFTISGEYAQLIPHQPKTIGERGTSFIDDFEGSETPFDLRLGNNWFLASTPEGQPDLFPEGNLSAPDNGGKRAKLAWYIIDPIFQAPQTSSAPRTPQNLIDNPPLMDNHYTRQIKFDEVYENRQLQQGQPNNLATFDLAYYPTERGPYNYNVGNFNADGSLKNAATNWGGVMRKIDYNDFEAANIDYIEMWVMSPFMYDGTNKGTMYIDLGQVSEDVVKDRLKSFENGLPVDPNLPNQTTTTPGGRVASGRALNNSFENNPNYRKIQDVGLDGWGSADERQYFKPFLDDLATAFTTNSAVYQMAFSDPSGDDYRYHSGDELDQQTMPVLERYKMINGQEGNSTLDRNPTGNYPLSRTNSPDDEDINGDFSLNTIEQYYQYKIEFDSSQMIAGQNYIVDVREAVPTLNNPSPPVPWYLIRIPINSYYRKVGDITDFKSIRFMRVMVNGFERPVVLRFAQMQLVRAEWRRYLKSLADAVDQPPTNPNDNTQFSVGTVNIEENASKTPVKYVVPPGFFRTIDPTTPGNVQQNEQSLSVKVCDLKDGDARGVFKTTRFDVRNYKKLQLFVHAEEAAPTVKDGDLHAFIRLGTDLESNYYEYSIPLTITRSGATNPDDIWPSQNEIDIALEEFYLTKQLRSNARAPLTDEFRRFLGDGKVIKVKGLPDMSNIRVIMLGVRNPLRADDPGVDDGLNKCAEVWFNELRVAEFINQGGWAANARAVAKLADFGTVSASLNYQSIGFGGIDKKLNDRNLNETFQYDITGTFELGKFLPAKSGISIPFFVGHSEQIIRPKYNPLNPDILLETAIKATPTQEEQDKIKRNAEDLTVRRSYNFTNVRKNRLGSKKPKVYDIENFNVTYSYTEIFQRNQSIAENTQKTYRASLGYNFNPQVKSIEPFKKIGKSPYLQLIREFNFTPFPQSLAFRFDGDRYYSRRINRNNDNPNTIIPVLYNKNFTLTRYYDFRWDLTRNLKVDFQATNNARVDEPLGKISKEETPDSVDVIIDNLKNLGRTTNYLQTSSVNYNVPLNKFPLTNWITLQTIYKSTFNWLTAPPAASSLGNTIQNSQQLTLQGQFNMKTLYDKVPYLKRVGSFQTKQKKKKQPEQDTTTTDGRRKEPVKEKEKSNPADGLVRFLMMVKNVNFNYSVTNGIALQGFTLKPQYIGNDFERNAPGLPFIFGSQDPQIRYRLAQEGYITTDTNLITPFTQTYRMDFTPKATLEPLRDMRIELNFVKTETRGLTSTFRYNNSTGEFEDFGLQEAGTYTVSFNSFRTSMSKIDALGHSAVFKQFENNRFTIAQRFSREDGRFSGEIDPVTGYPKGYGNKNQQVLIAAFLAAYSDQNAQNSSTSPFPKIPFPNWSLTYSGLNRIKAIGDRVSNITLSHRYSSTYNVANFITPFKTSDTTFGGNYIPQFEIASVTISEQFAPLIGVNVGLKNGLTTNFEYKSSRTVNLTLNGYNVTENKNSELVFGLGYKKRGVRLPFRIMGKKVFLKNDLDTRFEFSIRDTRTIIMVVDDVVARPTQGSRIVSIRPTINYQVNEKLNVRIFYNRTGTTPATTASFPTAITQAGIAVRYTIQ